MLQLSGGDLGRLDGGAISVRSLDVTDKREVGTLGLVRIRMTPASYVERLADIATFKNADEVLQIGSFSTPPILEDVATLTLDDSDIADLRRCRVGDCGLHLPAEAIERFARQIDWSRPDAADRANQLMRHILVEYVTAYLSDGAAATMTYANQRKPLSLEREFAALVEADAGGWRHFPELRQHLMRFPRARALHTTDQIYWSKEKVARKGVVTITHLAVAHRPQGTPAEYAIASKHIYGAHYYDASLGLTILVRDPLSHTPATYLAYLNRSRIDAFGGIFGGLTRSIVRSRAKATVSEQLARVKRMLESTSGS